jgi:hypothetical protein
MTLQVERETVPIARWMDGETKLTVRKQVSKAITSVDEDDERALSESLEMTGDSSGFTFFMGLYEPLTRSYRPCSSSTRVS